MAQIDASIPLQVKPPQFQTPFELQAQMNAMQQGQNQNRLAQMQFAEADRTNMERNQLRDIYRQSADASGAVDQNKLYSSLASGNRGDLIPGIQKTYNEAQSSGVKLNNDKLEGVKRQTAINDDQRMKVVQRLSAHIDDPNLSKESVLADIQSSIQSGDSTPEQVKPMIDRISQLPDGREPLAGFLTQIRNNFITPDKQAAASYKAKNDQAGRDVTIRGQDMTDARAHEAMAQGKKPVYNADAGGFVYPPSEQNPNGVLTPLAGAGPRKLTEVQGKAAMFGARADEADKTLGELEGKYSRTGLATKDSLGSVYGLGGILGGTANFAISDNTQKADQAQRDFVNAVLRQESGASISAPEFENARKQYFPQPGDSSAVVQQKARNRQTAIIGFKGMAGVGSYTAPPINPVGAGSGGAAYDADKEARYQAWKAQQGK